MDLLHLGTGFCFCVTIAQLPPSVSHCRDSDRAILYLIASTNDVLSKSTDLIIALPKILENSKSCTHRLCTQGQNFALKNKGTRKDMCKT